MHEMMPISSFKNKCFDAMRSICDLDLACQNLFTNQTQENIEKFIELAKKYQETSQELESSLIKFVDNITSDEDMQLEDEYKI
jgi:hypothetical protein